jgi:hypothetical protein
VLWRCVVVVVVVAVSPVAHELKTPMASTPRAGSRSLDFFMPDSNRIALFAQAVRSGISRAIARSYFSL